MFSKPFRSMLRGGLAFWIAATCMAQVEQGTLTGVVTDSSTAAVAGAKVVLTNVDTHVEATHETNGQGNYSFPFLPPGRYTVVAQKEGFSAERVTNVPDALASALEEVKGAFLMLPPFQTPAPGFPEAKTIIAAG